MSNIILAGDVGGTKTIFGLYRVGADPYHPLFKTIYASAEYPALETIVGEFLAAHQVELAGACICVAGPVIAARAQVTNLPWVVDAASLSQANDGLPVRLLNDLESTAYSIPYLRPNDLETLHAGKPQEHGSIGVIAPGTGLGEAYLVWAGSRYYAYGSEGGHTNFGPENELEMELLAYMLRSHAHVSYERVCSGIGIPNLYAFLRDVKQTPEPTWLIEQLSKSTDPTPVILEAAVSGKVELCTRTLEMFLSILGNEAGNLALKLLANGGIYLAGGIPRRILPQIKQSNFLQRFSHKGRFSQMLADIPVRVVLNPEAALLGAAFYAMEYDFNAHPL